jgi:hypothetical protein
VCCLESCISCLLEGSICCALLQHLLAAAGPAQAVLLALQQQRRPCTLCITQQIQGPKPAATKQQQAPDVQSALFCPPCEHLVANAPDCAERTPCLKATLQSKKTLAAAID